MSSLESSHLENNGGDKRTTAKASSFRERRRERERERERNESALFLLFLSFFKYIHSRARERENQTTPHGAEFEREFFHRVVVV